MIKTRIITGMNPTASFGNRFESSLRFVKPSATRDNSTYASNLLVIFRLFTSFAFSASHYNFPSPMRFAFRIGVSTIKYAFIVFLLLPLITFAETPEIKEYKVIKGDTLWDITKKELNDPFLWYKVWKENPLIANPNLIYPDQMIKILRYPIQEEKREDVVKSKSPEEITLQSTEKSQKPAIVAEQRYKGIKGIVLHDGNIIEGQIIFMSANIVKIRTKDGNVSSYSFIKELSLN